MNKVASDLAKSFTLIQNNIQSALKQSKYKPS